MKLKYYLRGAGIGFIVSAILFASFLTALDWGPNKGNASRQEAQMDEPLMGDTVAEAEEKKQEEATTGEVTTENVTPKVEVPQPEKTEEKPEVRIETQTKTDDQVEPVEEEPLQSADAVSFAIKDGESSLTIANNLVNLGLVDDAKAFDEFLSENGYDHRLRTGEFNISAGLSYKDLAETLCKKQ